ncbi:MAG: ribosome biogenesis GTPase YlqF [Polyangiaceae bacterium]
MSLQWYPGHMTKARRELAKRIASEDLVIEVLDARLPAASSNPVLEELRGDKPCVKVLTKSDLADAATTSAWIRRFEAQPRVSAFASTTERPGDTRRRVDELARAAVGPLGKHRPIRAVVAGVPNVGKSTLINTLMGRDVAKVRDKPAVTTAQQTVTLATGMVLTDSPGLMWPKIEDEVGAMRLALAGSIPDTAIDYLTVALFGAAYLLEVAAPALVARYKLPGVPASPTALLEEIGRRRGALRAGGVIDLHKASEVLVHEFRAGALGRISLEAPPI